MRSEIAADVVFLAHGRTEFTRASFAALVRNTDWALVRNLVVYTDGLPLPLGLLMEEGPPSTAAVDTSLYGGPVAVMNAYLAGASRSAVWAKVDNDTIVPPCWLNAALSVMERNPGLDLLGIEPWQSRTPAPWRHGHRGPEPERHSTEDDLRRGWVPCDAIGGLGMIRSACFDGRSPMKPHSVYGGFTDWQLREHAVVKGWIVPPLHLFLLDRLLAEPWASLRRSHVAAGGARPWTLYSEAEQKILAGWWLQVKTNGV